MEPGTRNNPVTDDKEFDTRVEENKANFGSMDVWREINDVEIYSRTHLLTKAVVEGKQC